MHALPGAVLAVLAVSANGVAQQPAQGRAEIAVTWADGSPAAGVQVRMYPVGAGIRGPLHARWRCTSADGRAVFEKLADGAWLCDGDRSGRMRVEVAGALAKGTLALAAGVSVRGTVVDEQGRPVPDARLWLSSRSNTEYEGVVLAAATADGTFALRDVEPGRLLRATAPGFAATRPLVVGEGSGPVSLCCDRPGRSLRGHVRDASGSPLADALVTADDVVPRQRPDWFPRGPAAHRPVPETRTDALGGFELLGVAAERVCIWVGHDTHAVACRRVEPGTDELDVELPPAVRVSGVVRDGAGDPVGGADVFAGSFAVMAQAGEGRLELQPFPMSLFKAQLSGVLQSESFAPDWSAPPWAQWQARTAADGSFAFDGLPRGAAFVRARNNGIALARIEAGRDARCELALEPGGELAGTVLTANEQALANWRVLAIPKLPGTSAWLGTMTDGLGHFRIVGCAAVPYDLVIVPQSTRYLDLPREGTRVGFGLLPGGPAVTLTSPSGGGTAMVSVHLQNPGGGSLFEAVLTFERPQGKGKETQIHLAKPSDLRVGLVGQSLVGPLPEGTWNVTARWRDLDLPFGELRLEAGQTLDLGTRKFTPRSARPD